MNTMDKNLKKEMFSYEENGVLLKIVYWYKKDTNKLYEIDKIFWVKNHLTFEPEFVNVTDLVNVIDNKGSFIENITAIINEELEHNKY